MLDLTFLISYRKLLLKIIYGNLSIAASLTKNQHENFTI